MFMCENVIVKSILHDKQMLTRRPYIYIYTKIREQTGEKAETERNSECDRIITWWA